MDFFDLLALRQSVRSYREGQIKPEELEKLLLAASAAPIGSARCQDIRLSVVQSRELMDALGEPARKRIADRREKGRNEAISSGLGEAGAGGSAYDPFYHAPTAIVISHAKQALQPGIEYSNAACVALSIQLAATQMGLGSVFLWYAFESMAMAPEAGAASLLKLPGGFEPILGVAVGYSEEGAKARALRPGRIPADFLP
jgi:nitroreductase